MGAPAGLALAPVLAVAPGAVVLGAVVAGPVFVDGVTGAVVVATARDGVAVAVTVSGPQETIMRNATSLASAPIADTVRGATAYSREC